VPSLEINSPTSLSLARNEGMDGCVCGRGVCCGVRSDFSIGVRVYLIWEMRENAKGWDVCVRESVGEDELNVPRMD
jgi:hypothetical protein